VGSRAAGRLVNFRLPPSVLTKRQSLSVTPAGHSRVGAGKPFTLRTDNDLAQLALIRSGAGIGVCQTAIARRDEAVVRVLAKQFSVPLETWITMHEDLHNSPRCKVTFEALVEGLQYYVRSSH
jgi:DNA-binding transcriptional LysR family regulator